MMPLSWIFLGGGMSSDRSPWGRFRIRPMMAGRAPVTGVLPFQARCMLSLFDQVLEVPRDLAVRGRRRGGARTGGPGARAELQQRAAGRRHADRRAACAGDLL